MSVPPIKRVVLLTLYDIHFQVYVPVDAPRFSCPGVPMVPIVSVFFNMFLFAQVSRILLVAVFTRIRG